MKRIGIVILVLLVIVVAASLGVGNYARSHGFSARGEPSPAEAFVAHRLFLLSIPGKAVDLKNPVQAGPEVLPRAMAHFADHCASCHGNDGRGNTLIGRGLYPKPPDMTVSTQKLTDGQIYYIIENGIRFTGMPAFGENAGDEGDQESWDLVHFIRHLPQMTTDEIAQMKNMDPKSPSELAKEQEIRKFLQGDDSPAVENVHEHHH
ncbi:MAG TPA: c-type cytochrome [Terriglobia bacterium]|jgi:mono/diheme cytochrome c family protein